MDTLKILLGATIALLLAALGLSWKNLQNGGGSTPKEKTDQEVQIEQLKLQQTQLQLEIAKLSNPQAGAPAPQGNYGGGSSYNSTAPAAPAPPTASEIELAKQQLAEIEKEKEKAAQDAKNLDNKEKIFIEGRDVKYESREAELRSRRIGMIQNSTTLAKVKEWVDTPDSGAFAVIDILSPQNVQPGTELVIRRNGGILGKLRIDELGGPDGTIANAVTKFTNAKPVPGDELIFEPDFVDTADGKYAPSDATPHTQGPIDNGPADDGPGH